MSGTINKRGKSWRIFVSGGTDANGKRVRHTETIHGTYQVARKRLAALEDRVRSGRYIANGFQTFDQYWTRWFPAKRLSIRPMTAAGYERLYKKHLNPALGRKHIQKITSTDIQTIVTEQVKKGNISTASHILQVLKVSFKAALQQGQISVNPTAAVEAPTAKRRELEILTPKDWQKVQAYVADQESHFLTAFTVLITTGVRRSELSGLKWKDIDLQRRLMHIRRSFLVVNGEHHYQNTKTDRSFRSVALDAGTVQTLTTHLNESIQLQSMFGRGVAPDLPVFTLDGSTPVRPDTLSHTWSRVAKALNLNVRLHDLRHTSATLMLAAGVPVGDVADRLGHATPAFTLTVYRHAIPGAQEAAAERLAALLNPAESNDVLAPLLAPSGVNASFKGQNSSVQREIGDGPGTRTPNLVIKSHLLCQLS